MPYSGLMKTLESIYIIEKIEQKSKSFNFSRPIATYAAFLCLAFHSNICVSQEIRGPSYNCSNAQDIISRSICGDRTLWETDLAFVQAYQILRHQYGEQGEAQLRNQARTFNNIVSRDCGVIAARPYGHPGAGPDPRRNITMCIAARYREQRAEWLIGLSGPAREEAERPISEHIALQQRLLDSGYLPPGSQIDGVYGPATRTAIAAWQRANERSQTGILGNDDARRLQRASSVRTNAPPSASAPARGNLGGQDLDGWGPYRWGMTPAQARDASELSLDSRGHWDNRNANWMVLLRSEIDNVGVRFEMELSFSDHSSPDLSRAAAVRAASRLAAVRLRTIDPLRPTTAFAATPCPQQQLLAQLNARYGDAHTNRPPQDLNGASRQGREFIWQLTQRTELRAEFIPTRDSRMNSTNFEIIGSCYISISFIDVMNAPRQPQAQPAPSRRF